MRVARSRRPSGVGARLVAVALLAAGAGLAACSGSHFSSSKSSAGRAGAAGQSAGSGAGAGGSAGTGALGGAAGSSGGGTSGGAGSGGAVSGGSGGAAAGRGGSSVGGEAGVGTAGGGDGCQCAAGTYCRNGTCLDCMDFSQLNFGEPEEILSYPGGDLRFPRSGPGDGSLFFTLVTSTITELWYSADLASSPGMPLDPDGAAPRSALDYFGDPGGLGFDVLFTEGAGTGPRALRAATFQAGVLGAPRAAPAPLGPTGMVDNFSAAFARDTGRAYWMSTVDGKPALVTGTLGGGGVGAFQPRVRSREGSASCPWQGDDATPWVTSDGTLLIFRAPSFDAACAPLDGSGTELFAVPLSPSSGKMLTNPIPLAVADPSATSTNDTDGSLSTDRCTLYFASDRNPAGGGKFRFYRAQRI